MEKDTAIKIILGITGGIAAYKSPDLLRRLRERGADVRVVMTPSAEKLVAATVFQAVSGEAVRTELWDEEAEGAMSHIELARWADLVLIAPATANVMAELAAGTANSLLPTLCLATQAPLLLAPAMNQAMWRNPATQQNLQTLMQRGIRFVGPAEGIQACGDSGPGRMAEPEEIVEEVFLQHRAATRGELQGLNVLVTAGPTREPIDPVRFISNRSSGKMGFAVAQAAAESGATVTLIAGPVSLPTPPGVERFDVETAAQMHAATLSRTKGADIYIGAAAISDYHPVSVQDHKIKKSADTMTLDMVKSEDVLVAVSALPAGPFTVGFAAETQKLETHARAKLFGKNLNMIIANLVGADLGFDCDDNSVLVLWRGGEEKFPCMPKRTLARELVTLIAARYDEDVNAPAAMRQPTLT
jgi:phosphopantothenoylcysteine decarboxylase/phosphopantothenate--cysteine ligase